MRTSILLVIVIVLYGLSSGLQAALIADPTPIDLVHVDLCFPYVNDAWDVHIRADLSSGSQSFRANEAVLVAGNDAKVLRPADPLFDAIGVVAGEPFWLMSQNGDIGLYLGFEASFNYDRTASMNLSHVQSWDADGPSGFNPAQKVVEIALVDVRGPGEFSMWFSYFEGPRFYMSTADDIDPVDTVAQEDGDDEYWQFVGGHSHVNWAFTTPGIYELDFQGRTVLANGTEVRSPVTTFYFSVVPEPGTASLITTGVVASIGAVVRRRRHR